MAATPDARHLVVNADDLGLTEGVTRGILAAHESGVVTSASMMVNTPGFADAVRRAAGHPTLTIGLHLNLTVGPPAAAPAAVASLLDAATGRFLPLSHLLRRVFAGGVDAGHVARECAAQIARLQAAGVLVTHLDSHRHVHALPGLLQPIVHAARQAGIRMVRRPLESPRLHPWRVGATLKKVAMHAVWRDEDFPAVLAGAEYFRGLACRAGRHFEADVLETLNELPPGTTELMVHPGHADEELLRWDSYAGGRELELRALQSKAVRERLARGDLTLISFSAR